MLISATEAKALTQQAVTKSENLMSDLEAAVIPEADAFLASLPLKEACEGKKDTLHVRFPWLRTCVLNSTETALNNAFRAVVVKKAQALGYHAEIWDGRSLTLRWPDYEK